MYKKFSLALIFLGVMLMSPSILSQDTQDAFKLAVQAWSFNRFTFYEAIDKAASLGLKYIEAYPGQKLSKDKSNITFGPDIPRRS